MNSADVERLNRQCMIVDRGQHYQVADKKHVRHVMLTDDYDEASRERIRLAETGLHGWAVILNRYGEDCLPLCPSLAMRARMLLGYKGPKL